VRFLLGALIILCAKETHAQKILIDKQKHFAAGFVLGGVYSINREVKRPMLSSLAVSLTAAVAKEAYDTRVGGITDFGDVYATVAGGAMSGAICYLIKRKQNQKQYETINFHFTNRTLICIHRSVRRRCRADS